jgi:DNA-binding CsgD family transcriptional regulator
LIPCDHAGYNAIDVRSGQATVVADPPGTVFDGGAELLAEFARQNPLIVRADAGDTNVMRLSDHMTQRELHGTELYDYVYRVVGLEYQLGVTLPPVSRELGRPTEFVGLSLARGSRDFGEGDRRLLAALAPLFGATLLRLHELALLRATQTADGGRGHAMVLVDAAGTVAWASAEAQARLGLAAGSGLPASLRRWLFDQREPTGRGSAATAPVLAGHPVWPRLLPRAYPELDAIHLACPQAPADADALRSLGLTRRQSEVLALVLEGLSSREIGDRLTLSPRTVEKHIDSVYARLGVRNRSQAVAAAMRRLAA